jgi:protein-disulfide isomerase
VNNTTRFYPMLIPLAFVLGLMAGYITWGRSPALPARATAPSAAPTAASQADTNSPTAENSGPAEPAAAESIPQVVRYDVPIDDDPILGPESASITIIEFSDYECPYCRKWHLEVFPLLREKYPDQIRYVFRDFPLTSIHPNAVPAAEAANCANEQGKFWEFNEALFLMREGLSQQAYEKYAKELGLEMGAFGECISSGRHQGEVLADLQWAADLGVRSTPTFFLNGIALVGAQPYEVFEQVIEKELAGEIP